MKTRFLIFFILLFSAGLTVISAQIPPKRVNTPAFKKGEKLEFRVFYNAMLTGNVTAGYATLEVKSDDKMMNGRPVYHVVGEGTSRRAFDWFFKVRDRLESYFDINEFIPYYFVRRTREGGYIKDDDVKFDHNLEYASSRNALKKIPYGVQDVISAFYYARTLDFSEAKLGQNFSIPFFLDDSVYTSVIQFHGRETVKTELGEFRCLKFKPMVATGNVFSNPYPMTLWVTDDDNRLPVKGESAVVVGTVKMELINYFNLANSIKARVY
ncbi:MAG: DUF3108 domain-containing protein [Bacteroidales bacterium]